MAPARTTQKNQDLPAKKNLDASRDKIEAEGTVEEPSREGDQTFVNQLNPVCPLPHYAS